ncbi:MAG: branched-chain amino acid--2-keto-4-methylthiobutyrate aminotransferase, partial [Candidatus Thioglobus sp.]|nr:branched-chain amino acid--2-keto-4-methylthiobutyrate aminotransferase [Candidatus Thioglobus sp.]
FIEKQQAFVPVMDRGFLFGDGVYEVIPVYHGKIFHLAEHLKRLQKSLDAIQISNPFSAEKYSEIINKLTKFSAAENQSVYLQITRGVDKKRKHSFAALAPTVYIESNPLLIKSKQALEQGFAAISQIDIRWQRCDIKAISLLPNILYAQLAKDKKVEEIILFRNNKITEGATSNVFLLKGDRLFTHPVNENILAGITRNLVLKSAKICGLKVEEIAFSLDDTKTADGLWISGSTREVMPIITFDQKPIANGEISPYWHSVYEQFQRLKNA